MSRSSGTGGERYGRGRVRRLALCAAAVMALAVPTVVVSPASAKSGGVVAIYPEPSVKGPVGIVAGPDGALWFTTAANDSIGRITTAGTITSYTDPTISDPCGITVGPDGALWFTNSSATRSGGSPRAAPSPTTPVPSIGTRQ